MNGHDLGNAIVGQLIGLFLLAALGGAIFGSITVLVVWIFS